MSRVYSARLAALESFSGDSPAYVVPPGEVWVIKQITWYAHTFGPVTEFSITGLDTQVYFSGSAISLPAWGTQELRITLEPDGDFFQLHANFSIDLHVDGFRLALP